MDFWNGLGQVGGMHLGLNVIGFSLPDHDDYLKVTLFKMAQNYQELNWDIEMLDKLKDNIKVIDYRIDDDGKNEPRGRYNFFLITTMIQPFRTTLKGFCSGGLNHGGNQERFKALFYN